jgi:hypothetical protein
MIRVSEIGFELSKGCPEFQRTWDEYVNWMTTERKPRDRGTDALVIASFLNELYNSQQTNCFPCFFASVERLIIEGEPDTKSTVEQVLKRLAMLLVRKTAGAELYASWMGPQTKRLSDKVWKELLAKRATQ